MNWNYITGFFDADGSITYITNNKNKPKTPQISFHNCELGILEEIRDFIFKELGIKGFISTKKSKDKNHNTAYDLKYLRFPKCLKLSKHIKSIHPKKKLIIKSLKEVYNLTPRNGKYTNNMLYQRTLLVEQILNDRAH